MPRQPVLSSSQIVPTPAYPDHSQLFRRASLVDAQAGSVHMGLGLCLLGAGGRVDTHIHSFEESFYVLDGEVTLVLDGRGYPLSAGSCGVVPVGVSHGWRGPRAGTGRWIDMMAPQPRSGESADDTFFIDASETFEAGELDIRDPRSRHLFRIDEADIALDALRIGARLDAPTVSASMSTALLAYSGIAVKMLVDQRLDAQLSTMFMVEYQPGG